MHRVDDSGDGWDDGFYHDKASPRRGTIDRASEANSEMMELCNVVTLAGDTLAADAASDETAGWHQVYDAIFENGHLTDSAINHLSFDVITAGTINVLSGDDNWNQSISGLSFAIAGANLNVMNAIYQRTTQEGVITRFSGRGIRFENGPGNNSAFNSMDIRKAAYDVDTSSTSWTDTYSVGSWKKASSLGTEIPDSSTILQAFIRYETGTSTVLYPAHISGVMTGGFFTITNWHIVNGDTVSEPPHAFTVLIEYDAANVTVP